MSDDPVTLEERENGPFIVKNLKAFRMPDGAQAEVKPAMALCRCGASKNKPFCDGSHKEAGYDSSPAQQQDAATRDRVMTYSGSEATIYYNRLLCSHAGECGAHASNIFSLKQKPWIQPDNGTVDQIKEVVAACPSGALRLSVPGQDAHGIAGDESSISIEANGPYHVQNIPIKAGYWAEGQDSKKYVLCRCGLSKNKPFCDGTHQDEGWKDGS